MDLKILEIASNTENNVINNFTHLSKIRIQFVEMKWKLV